MKKLFGIILIFCVLLSSVLAGCASREYTQWEAEYFGDELCAEIDRQCSQTEKETVQPILDEVENAFAYDDANNDCEEKFGVLSCYCYDRRFYSDVVSETHKLEFVTAGITGDNGYIWIRYSHEGFDKNGELTTGSMDILSRIEVQIINGTWTAVSINEAP